MNPHQRRIRRHPKTLVVSLVVALIAALTGACSSDDSSGSSGGGEINWAIDLATTWDPVTSQIGWDIFTLNIPYEGLTQISKEGTPLPGLAESWDYNDEGNEITFHLREGLTFSDGEPLDAEAVKFDLERKQTQEDSRNIELLQTIEKIEALDERDVKLTLSQADFQIPLLLGGRPGLIASPKAAQEDQKKLEEWPVGAGPFKITEFVRDDHATFEKNPDYWNADAIKIDKITVYPRADAASVVSAVQTGVYNVAMALPAQARQAEDLDGLKVAYTETGQIAGVQVNNNIEPFDDPKVVEAFRYAWDRQEFVDKVTLGTGYTSNQGFPARYPQANADHLEDWPYDPAKAKALLSDAGYEPGDIKLEYYTQGTNPTFGEVVQSQLKKIGVDVTIKVITAEESRTLLLGEKPVAALAETTSTGRESPVQALLAYYGPQGLMNLSKPYATDRFLDALDKLRLTPLDDPNYEKTLKETVWIATEENPTNYLYDIPWTFVTDDGVSGLDERQGQIRWEDVTVSQ